MPDLTPRTICTTALRLLGVASAETPLEADMAMSALDALNSLLDAWSTEKLLTYTRPKIPLVLIPSKAAYTWGLTTPPCDIPYETPVRLDLVLLTVDTTPPGLEWELEILDQYVFEAQITLKQLTSTYPACVYLEQSEPVAVLHIWPVPDLPYTLQLLPWQAHSPYTHFDHAISWPAGYQRALTYGLACEIGPQYGVEASPTVSRIAEESKRAIFVLNTEVGRLSLTPGRRVGGSPFGYPKGFLQGTR